MKIVFFSIQLALFLCAFEYAKPYVSQPVNLISLKTKVEYASSLITQSKDTSLVYIPATYYKPIPKKVILIIKRTIPEWKLPDPDIWDNDFCKAYQSANSLSNYFSADFNGDHQPDYALILINNIGELAVWAILSNNTGYTPTKVSVIDKKIIKKSYKIAITGIRPGSYDYDIHDNPDHELIAIKNFGIKCINSDQYVCVTYWDNGKRKEFVLKN